MIQKLPVFFKGGAYCSVITQECVSSLPLLSIELRDILNHGTLSFESASPELWNHYTRLGTFLDWMQDLLGRDLVYIKIFPLSSHLPLRVLDPCRRNRWWDLLPLREWNSRRRLVLKDCIDQYLHNPLNKVCKLLMIKRQYSLV